MTLLKRAWRARFFFLSWVALTLLACGYGALAQSEVATDVAFWLFLLGGFCVFVYEIYAEFRHQFRRSGTRSFLEWITKSFLGWMSSVCWTIGICAVVIGIVAAGYAIYTFADSEGYIQHTVETTISARSDWLPGESKECLSYTRKREWATFQDKEVGYAMPWVKCDDGPDHHMKVTFYGRKVQPEYQTIGWRCSRNEVSFLNDNSFTCYQRGGER